MTARFMPGGWHGAGTEWSAELVRGFFTAGDRPATLSPGVAAVLILLARPVLRLHLALYKLDVRRAQFPVDNPERVIPGPDPVRLMFIGDVTVSGYGVLHQGMTTVAKTARFVAETCGRGCSWTTISANDLTAARVAKMSTLDATPVDVVLVMLGVPDVLLATSTNAWKSNLETILEQLRNHTEPNRRVVFAGIPPMVDFRPVPPLGRKMLRLQIDRLNSVTHELASRAPDVSFVPFPDWRVGDMYVQDAFSWKSLHEMWARVLAATTLQALTDTNSDRRESGSENLGAS
ncbi:SGNH/GDSL hydrolase family protein [Lacisediminihabitans profunda]|nr:SGNH/GDSL hydrolase family protein [Lacisediminihabitans profunda]